MKGPSNVINMFTGKTSAEEVADMEAEELGQAKVRKPVDDDADAVRWLKTDAGINDEISLCCHDDGRVVMQFHRVTNSGTRVGVSSFLLTKLQADNLSKLLQDRSAK